MNKWLGRAFRLLGEGAGGELFKVFRDLGDGVFGASELDENGCIRAWDDGAEQGVIGLGRLGAKHGSIHVGAGGGDEGDFGAIGIQFFGLGFGRTLKLAEPAVDIRLGVTALTSTEVVEDGFKWLFSAFHSDLECGGTHGAAGGHGGPAGGGEGEVQVASGDLGVFGTEAGGEAKQGEGSEQAFHGGKRRLIGIGQKERADR